MKSAGRRIAVGHTIYAFKEGGMERGLLNIINYGRCDQFSHVIICLTEAGRFAKQITSPFCRVVELLKKDGHDLGLPGRIARIARAHQLDVLHARGWPALVETALAARLANVATTVYGFHGKTQADLDGINPLRRICQAALIRSYTVVTTLNERMRSDLARESYLSPERIRVISNGVDLDRFRPRADKGELRSRYDLPRDRFIVGNVARLDPVKNHEVVFRAISQIPKPARPFFVIVGEGGYRSHLEQSIRSLGLGGDVRLMGHRDEIPELLNCMDVYIQSSFYEGFSNTILEAMACGLPVVVTDVGGTRDLLYKEHNDFLFRPEETEALVGMLLKLVGDRSFRNAMGNQGRSHVKERFSVQSMVAQYEDMYEGMVCC